MTLAVDVGRVTTESCPPLTLPELKRVWGPCQPSVPTQGLGSSSRLCLPQGGLQTPALPTPARAQELSPVTGVIAMDPKV